MDNSIVIEAKGVEVSYLIQNEGLSSMRQFLMTFGRRRLFQEKHVLKGIDLDVYKGECLGFLGRNGCGKSTLLKTLAGIITPDKGQIRVNGRIAPMLGLGIGLETELSGMENIKLCGALMGLTKKEINSSLEYILEFSELGKDINMQVKRYSSGMMARLGFSISVAIQPDILIIDEALSVGDQGFQQKCFKRIQELKMAGTTILFVSHSEQEVLKLCNRAAWIKDGIVELIGPAEEVVSEYRKIF
ncbi:MAG: ABC transporter ATP-binding protein [Cytophagaceae bacterium]